MTWMLIMGHASATHFAELLPIGKTNEVRATGQKSKIKTGDVPFHRFLSDASGKAKNTLPVTNDIKSQSIPANLLAKIRKQLDLSEETPIRLIQLPQGSVKTDRNGHPVIAAKTLKNLMQSPESEVGNSSVPVAIMPMERVEKPVIDSVTENKKNLNSTKNGKQPFTSHSHLQTAPGENKKNLNSVENGKQSFTPHSHLQTAPGENKKNLTSVENGKQSFTSHSHLQTAPGGNRSSNPKENTLQIRIQESQTDRKVAITPEETIETPDSTPPVESQIKEIPRIFTNPTEPNAVPVDKTNGQPLGKWKHLRLEPTGEPIPERKNLDLTQPQEISTDELQLKTDTREVNEPKLITEKTVEPKGHLQKSTNGKTELLSGYRTAKPVEENKPKETGETINPTVTDRKEVISSEENRKSAPKEKEEPEKPANSDIRTTIHAEDKKTLVDSAGAKRETAADATPNPNGNQNDSVIRWENNLPVSIPVIEIENRRENRLEITSGDAGTDTTLNPAENHNDDMIRWENNLPLSTPVIETENRRENHLEIMPDNANVVLQSLFNEPEALAGGSAFVFTPAASDSSNPKSSPAFKPDGGQEKTPIILFLADAKETHTERVKNQTQNLNLNSNPANTEWSTPDSSSTVNAFSTVNASSTMELKEEIPFTVRVSPEKPVIEEKSSKDSEALLPGGLKKGDKTQDSLFTKNGISATEPARGEELSRDRVIAQTHAVLDETMLQNMNDSRSAQTSPPPAQEPAPAQNPASTTNPGANPVASPASTNPRVTPSDTPTTSSETYSEMEMKYEKTASQQIVRAVQGNISPERSHINIRLFPESLGQISVQLKMENGTLNAMITAQKESTRAMLEENLSVLRSAFDDQGLRVERLLVAKETWEGRQQQESGKDGRLAERWSRGNGESNPRYGREGRGSGEKSPRNPAQPWKDQLTTMDYFM